MYITKADKMKHRQEDEIFLSMLSLSHSLLYITVTLEIKDNIYIGC